MFSRLCKAGVTTVQGLELDDDDDPCESFPTKDILIYEY